MNEATLLYVSDDPEGFKDHGRLFDAPMPRDGRSIRLLFDHVNEMTVPMRVLVGVTNVGTTPASVEVRGGVAGPDASGINVGHAATARYLRARSVGTDGASSLHGVAIGASYVLFDAIVPSGACVAGIYDLLGRGELGVLVLACDPEHDALTIASCLPEAPDDGKSRRGIFDIAATREAVYVLDVAIPAEVIIGAKTTTYPRAPEDKYGGQPHVGEYGVVKRFALRADASGRERRLALIVTPRGGGASATIVGDAVVVEAEVVQPPGHRKLVKRTVAANQPFAVDVMTMAEINSTYPVHFTLVSDDNAPADIDADGSGVTTTPIYA